MRFDKSDRLSENTMSCVQALLPDASGHGQERWDWRKIGNLGDLRQHRREARVSKQTMGVQTSSLCMPDGA